MGKAEVGEDVGDLVVHRVHERGPVGVGGEPLPRQRQGVGSRSIPTSRACGNASRIASAWPPSPRVASTRRRRTVERGREKGDDPVEEDRDVAGVGICLALPTQCHEQHREPRERNTEEASEKAITATDLAPDPGGARVRAGGRRSGDGDAHGLDPCADGCGRGAGLA